MNYELNMRIKIYLFVFLFCAVNSSPAQDVKELFKQGQIHFNNARFDSAIVYYTNIIAVDAAYMKAYLQRGFCKNIIKDFPGAIEDFTKVIELDPMHQWAYVSRGSAKNKTGEYQSAIDDFNKGLELNPSDQEAYNNRGFSKKALGDKAGACADWVISKKLGNEEAVIILANNRCK